MAEKNQVVIKKPGRGGRSAWKAIKEWNEVEVIRKTGKSGTKSMEKTVLARLFWDGVGEVPNYDPSSGEKIPRHCEVKRRLAKMVKLGQGAKAPKQIQPTQSEQRASIRERKARAAEAPAE